MILPRELEPPAYVADQREWFSKLSNEGMTWFGLRAVDLSKPCSCKDASGRVTALCTRCLQIGYQFTDYLIKGYYFRRNRGVEYQAEMGVISTDSGTFLGFHDRPINRWDILLALDLDPETAQPRQPFKIRRSFIISSVDEARGRGGRIEFYSCQLEERALSDYRPGP